MCGIIGIWQRDSSPVDLRLLENMAQALAHRGPDDAGSWLRPGMGLAHRRLSIIDLTPAAHQPMRSPDGNLTIVYNGEIYNYLELRDELIRLGQTFRSHSDTEVILAAFRQWGSAGIEKLSGMFSFALWDEAEQQLFCARDRLGIKPFYYYYDGSHFIFASEIKALLLHPLVSRRAAEQPIYDFLRWGMLDHTEQTFFADIVSLPPAHFLQVSANGLRKQRYWDFTVSDTVHSTTDASAKFREHFARSIHWHLRSDVPVGFLLSGGLDSSAIVCMANEVEKNDTAPFGERYRIFSSCFPGSRFDETSFIRTVLTATQIRGHFITSKPERFLTELDDLLYHQEEPFGGTSIFAQWSLMRAVRQQGIKVVLDGQGADEQLGGYRKFYFFYLQELLRRQEWSLGLREAVHFFTSISFLLDLQWQQAVLRYFARSPLQLSPEYYLKSDFAERFRERELPFGYTNSLAERFKLDITRFSLPVLLRHEDRNSMAFSIESRVPFLDHQLVEFVAALPFDQKLRSGWTKYVLRRGLTGILPRRIQLRKSKLGFQTPEDLWFKQILLQPLATTLAQARFLPRFAKTEPLLALYRQDSAKKFTNRPASFYFRFFILEHWARVFQVE